MDPGIDFALEAKAGRIVDRDLKAYYRAYYYPVNAFVVVVGDFKKEDVLSMIEKTFGSIHKGAAPNQKKEIDPPQTGERRVSVKRRAQLPFIVMGYHVPTLREPDSYVLEVIATILSGGKSSRLHQSLVREKRLALDTEADNFLLSHDPGLVLSMLFAEILSLLTAVSFGELAACSCPGLSGS